MKISSILIAIDQTSNKIPLVSTATNLVNLFQKYAIIPFMSEERIRNSPYFSHINQKSTLECWMLLIPLVGNLWYARYKTQTPANSQDEASSTEPVNLPPIDKQPHSISSEKGGDGKGQLSEKKKPDSSEEEGQEISSTIIDPSFWDSSEEEEI